MKNKLFRFTCALLCISGLLSCEKEEKPLPTKGIPVSFEQNLGINYFFPELETTPSVQYDEEMGYYIPFHHMEWEQPWSCGSVFIPSQSSSFTVKAYRVENEDYSGWDAQDVSNIILSDLHLPEEASGLAFGSCPSAIKLHVALGENVPYRKVTLEDFSVRFPEWFRAKLSGTEPFGSIPELEVTPEGVDLDIWLSSIYQPTQFEDGEGKLCYSVETTFEARVLASPEDAIGPVSDKPSELEFRCTLEFSQINFTSCGLTYKDISFPETTFTWNPAELPSFLCGGKTNITFTRPRMLLEFQNDYPFYESAAHVAALNDDKKAEFSVTGNLKYMYMANGDSNYREDIFNRNLPALGTIFHSPFSDGELHPSISFLPVSSQDGLFTPGQKYQMGAKVDLMVPLAFTGELDIEAIPTPPLVLEGRSLEAPGESTHVIQQIIGNSLPIACRITPVFTMEGEDPVFLNDFILVKNSDREITYRFHPTKDDWEATLHYLVTPLRSSGEYLKKDAGFSLMIRQTRFTVNVPVSR